jgi:hypothetical protein
MPLKRPGASYPRQRIEMNAEQVRKTLMLLQTTCQTLQALAREKQKNPRSVDYFDTFTLVAAARIVQKTIDGQLRAAGATIPSTPLIPYPTIPPEVGRNPSEITKSEFYTLCWGHLMGKKP